MKVITLVAIAICITGMSFAGDRLDSIPSMSGKIEIMDQLGLVEPAESTQQVQIPKAERSRQKSAPARVKMHHLADTMTMGD